MRWSLCLVDLCVLIECQPCFDDERTCSLLIPDHIHTCSHMLTAAPSPRFPPEVPGCWRRVPVQTAGEQLAYHHARLDARIVITTRREYMHYTKSVLLTMCLMQFVTCCALPFTHPSLFSIIFFLCETIWEDSWQEILMFGHVYHKLKYLWLWMHFFSQSHSFDS